MAFIWKRNSHLQKSQVLFYWWLYVLYMFFFYSGVFLDHNHTQSVGNNPYKKTGYEYPSPVSPTYTLNNPFYLTFIWSWQFASGGIDHDSCQASNYRDLTGPIFLQFR